MIIEKLETKNGIMMGVDTVEQREELLALGIDVDRVEAEEGQRLAIQAVKDAIQTKLDSTARAYDYEDMKSARAWRNTDGYSQNDLVEALTVWSGRCWDKAREVQGLVMKGKRGLPTPAEMLELLPVFSFGDKNE